MVINLTLGSNNVLFDNSLILSNFNGVIIIVYKMRKTAYAPEDQDMNTVH